MPIVVKREGHKETFDEKKVYGSVYAACASAQYGEKECEVTANKITKKVLIFAEGRKELKSVEIRNKIAAELKKMGKELAFYYEQHLPNLAKL